jgi:peptidoglycan/LPS O-acetylase OafA/YrhL
MATVSQDPPATPAEDPNPHISGTAVEHTRLGDRMEFLDALRALAAMCVVVQHSLEPLFPAVARSGLERFRLGEFGVALFFLCSGFIIPASLERQGSQARFWVGRVFRLFPLYWVVLGTVLVLHYGFDKYPLPPAYLEHPVRATVANLTMLQNFLSQPLALGQTWSLAYELVFYGLVSALFIAALHRRSVLWSTVCFAIAMVVNTRHIPPQAIHQWGNRTTVVLIVTLAVVVAGVLHFTRGRGPQRWLCLGICVVSVPLVLNQPEGMSTAMFFFGTLFFGTCLYRVVHGEMAPRRLIPVAVVAVATIVIMWTTADVYWGIPNGVSVRSFKMAEITTFLAAYAVFGIALCFRARKFPRWILWLGTVSYSLYLVHGIPIYAVGEVFGNRAADAALWVGLSVAISAVTYTLIERPFITLGRRLAKRATPRPLPPDPVSAVVPGSG